MQDESSQSLKSVNTKRFFITGTDTDAGKTFVTCALIEKIQQSGSSVMAIKPIAAGCEHVVNRWVNQDALMMQQHLQQSLDYPSINPIALKAAIAPHLAAQEQGVKVSVKELSKLCNIQQWKTDVVLIEGAGGWLVPLNGTETMADFVVAEQLDVILVVGMKLGCINHALLTVQAISNSGLKLAGWIANSVETEMDRLEQNIETLQQQIKAPLLGVIPNIQSTNPVQIALGYVSIEPLISTSF